MDNIIISKNDNMNYKKLNCFILVMIISYGCAYSKAVLRDVRNNKICDVLVKYVLPVEDNIKLKLELQYSNFNYTPQVMLMRNGKVLSRYNNIDIFDKWIDDIYEEFLKK